MALLTSIEISRIRDLARAGDYRAAGEALNAIESVDGATTEVLQLGAEIVAMAGNHRGALEILKKLVGRSPKSARTFRLAGRSFEAINDFVNARRAYLEASDLDPSDDFSLAHAANMFEATNEFATALTLAKRLESRAPSAQQRFDLRLMQASCLYHLGNDDESFAMIEPLLAQSPEDPRLLTLQGRVLMRFGQTDRAREIFQTALQHAPESEKATLRNLIDFVDGNVGDGLDTKVTESLFDRYAAKFDSHLVGRLKYSAPELISRVAREHFKSRSFDLLDLGCGTGLVAETLADLGGGRVGVDLSEKMLREAQKKALYFRLHQVDIRQALNDTQAESFDFITAADVFNYVGKIDDISRNAWRVLRDDGMFCFTLELDESNPNSAATATPSMRILHGETAVRALLTEVGFHDVEIESFVMRYEAGEPVNSAMCSGVKRRALQ